LFWQGEGEEEVVNRKEGLAVVVEPILGHRVLALGAVAVFAGVIGIVMLLTGVTEIHMAAHG
jgi:hypothetical protein